MKTIIMLSTVQAAVNLAKQNELPVETAQVLYDLYQIGEKKRVKDISYSVLS